MSLFKSKTRRKAPQFQLVPGPSKWGECPGMSPSHGKYLACWSLERAALEQWGKKMSKGLICLPTQLWRWKKCLYLTHTTLDFVCVCADNPSTCVCEEWMAEQRAQVDCCLLWTSRCPFTQPCEKYSTPHLNISADMLSWHSPALLTKYFTV